MDYDFTDIILYQYKNNLKLY